MRSEAIWISVGAPVMVRSTTPWMKCWISGVVRGRPSRLWRMMSVAWMGWVIWVAVCSSWCSVREHISG